MNNIIISDPTNFKRLKENFKAGGLKQIHVLSDFDRTLTKSYVGGKRVASITSILYDKGYLTPDYPAKAKALANKYGSIELDLTLSREARKREMENWWREHFTLLIASGLNRADIKKAILDESVILRSGAAEFLSQLNAHNIPLVFLSASGLGQESIKFFLKKEKQLFPNIHVISNDFIFSETGQVSAVKEPIVHILNKDETLVKDFPCYEEIKNRRNIILIGDSIDDIDMVVGFPYVNLIKFGFLNDKLLENLKKYQEAFDVIITGDGSFVEINKFLRELIS